MVWSSLAPKWPIPVLFCGMDHQNYNFLLISDTLSVRGCWGQPMSFSWKLVDETQMSNPPEAASYRNSTKLLIFLPLRAIYFYSLWYETPCSMLLIIWKLEKYLVKTKTCSFRKKLANYMNQRARTSFNNSSVIRRGANMGMPPLTWHHWAVLHIMAEMLGYWVLVWFTNMKSSFFLFYKSFE